MRIAYADQNVMALYVPDEGETAVLLRADDIKRLLREAMEQEMIPPMEINREVTGYLARKMRKEGSGIA